MCVTPVFQGQLTTWGGKSLPGGNSPPLLYIALWGVEIPPPLTELSHGKGGGIHPPFADLSQGKQKDPLEKYAFIQQNLLVNWGSGHRDLEKRSQNCNLWVKKCTSCVKQPLGQQTGFNNVMLLPLPSSSKL